MLKIALLTGAFIVIIVMGLQKVGRDMAQELIAILKKAHLEKSPVGKYTDQRFSTRRFSRDALRLPVDAVTCQQMDRCSIVHKHDVSCRIVSSKATFRRCTICLSLSISFDGEISDGERVWFETKNALISAVVILEKHEWQLMEIHTIASPGVK